MVRGIYKKPGIRTFGCSDVLEKMGPGCAASGTLNMDMYRGEEAMLEKTYEYRVAEKIDLEIKNLDSIEKAGEVAHV